MSHDPSRISQLVEEALALGLTPEVVCVTDPELIREVRRMWEKCRRNDVELSELFSPPPIDESPAMPLEGTGSVIGRYKLIRQIGEGGFGIVYLAEQSTPVRRQVALKVIKPGMDTREVIGRFEAERQALAMMDHPNIARVFDAGTTDSGRPYFVMELVEGVPITMYCDANQSTTPQRLELMIVVCRAVQSAHQKGIIHRDLKPSNVLVTMLDGRAVPKIIDFGIAKATASSLGDTTMHTALGGFVGTPAYMSPEQAERSDTAIDTRTDVFGLGAIIYELLTGSTPIDSATLKSASLGEVARLIREAEASKPSTKVAALGDTGVPVAAARGSDPRRLGQMLRGELDWIVMKALEKDRTRRYDTAAALADDLARYLADEPVAAGPPSGAYRFRKFARRHRAAIGVAAIVTTTLLLGVAGTTIGLVLEGRQRQVAEARRTEAVGARQLAERRQADADIQRRTAQATIAFLVDDVLAKASPEHTTDRSVRDILVKALIEPAIATVNKRFGDEPLVRAAVQETLAITLLRLGRFDLGLTQAEAALRERQAALGDDHPDTIAALDIYAQALGASGKCAEADASLRRAWEQDRRVLGDDHPNTLEVLEHYTQSLEFLQRYDEAEPLSRQTYDRRRRLLGDDHPDTIRAQRAYALLLSELGRPAEAKPLARQAWERSGRVEGEEDISTVRAANTYARVLSQLGQAADAEKLLRQGWERDRRVLGDQHPETIWMQTDYAVGLAERGNLAAAEPLLAQAWQSSRRARGDDNPDTMLILKSYASSIVVRSRLAAAAVYSDAVAADRRAGRAQTAPFAELLYEQADFLRESNDVAGAVVPLREATDLLRNIAPDNPHRGRDLYWLGACLLSSGHAPEAEEVFREDYIYDLQQLGPDREHLRGSLQGLIDSRRAQNKPADLAAIRAEYRRFATTKPAPTTSSSSPTDASAVKP